MQAPLNPVLDLFGHPQLLIEIGILLLCLMLAWLASRWLRPHHDMGFVRRSLRSLAFPLLGLGLLALMSLASHLNAWHLHVVPTVAKLLWAMVGIRMLIYALQRSFPNALWIRSFGRTVMLIVWGVLALDMFGVLPDLIVWLNGFQLPLGKKSISLWEVMQGFASVAGALLIALWAGGVIEERLLATRGLDPNLRVVASRLTQAVLILVAIFVGAELVGLDLTALSVFGGALGVGLGLGMQKIASSYVSGFIILLDRSIKIGNLIQVGNERGEVLSITTRYTVLRALSGTHFIVPNDTLVSSTVTNDSYVSPATRVTVSVQVGYGTDIEAVLPMLLEIAKAQPRVISEPAPSAFLLSFDDSGMTLELGVWINDPQNGSGGLKSDMNRAILRRFRDEGIEIPFPQREVRVLGRVATAPVPDAAQALPPAGDAPVPGAG